MTYEDLIKGTPFKFKQVKGVFKVLPYNDGYAVFLQKTKNFVYIERIKEIGKFGIEFDHISPIFETSFLHIMFIRHEK